MTRRKIDRVRKRDGRVVEYDERKLAEAIHRAARTAGQDNRYLADDLAGVVTTYLERHHDRETPTSEEIRHMVERILFETGHAEVARAYLVHGESKRRRAEPAEPAEPAQGGELFPSAPVLVEGATRDEVSTWGRERISSALVKEAAVDPQTADEIAAAVERRIFQQGERRVSSTVIRELVNQELMARGHGSKMRRQLVVGLPKYDLDRMIRPAPEGAAPPDPDRLCRLIGETTLKQYALQELLPREVADAHLEGRIHIHDLEYPQKLHWLAAPAGDVRGAAGSLAHLASDDARTLTACVASWAAAQSRLVAAGLELGGLDAAYAARLAGRTEEEIAREAAHLALVLSAADRPALLASVEIAPRRTWPEPAREAARAFLRHLVSALVDRPAGLAVSVAADAFDDEDCLALLRETGRLAAARGGVRYMLDRGGVARRVSRFARRGPAEPDDEPFALAQAVTLNLPQAVVRGEAGGELYAELETALAAAVRAHLVKRALLKRPRSERFEYAVGVCGLDEAVRLACGASMASDEAALRLGIRILSFLFFRVKEEADRHGLRLALHDVDDAGAGPRFLRIDRQMFARVRGLEAETYAPGVHLRPETLGPAEALWHEARFHTLMTQAAVRLDRGTSPADLLVLLRGAARETLCSQVLVP